LDRFYVQAYWTPYVHTQKGLTLPRERQKAESLPQRTVQVVAACSPAAPRASTGYTPVGVPRGTTSRTEKVPAADAGRAVNSRFAQYSSTLSRAWNPRPWTVTACPRATTGGVSVSASRAGRTRVLPYGRSWMPAVRVVVLRPAVARTVSSAASEVGSVLTRRRRPL